MSARDSVGMYIHKKVFSVVLLKPVHRIFLIVLVTFLPIFYVTSVGSSLNRKSELQTVGGAIRPSSLGTARAVYASQDAAEQLPTGNRSEDSFRVKQGQYGNIKLPDNEVGRNTSGNSSKTDEAMPMYIVNSQNRRNVSTWIRKTHSDDETRKFKLVGKKFTRQNLCQLWPRELVGSMKVSPDMNISSLSPDTEKLIEKGGKFRPNDCQPRERVAIIIPYRDRNMHLEIILNHLHTVLQRQKMEYGIFVVEMAYPTQFNRGLLANVGFLTAASISDYTCYIIHDVDLIVKDDRNMYRCGRVPRHLTAHTSKFKYSLPYLAYFGGVEAFTPDQYWQVNGFSNLFFGWGGEDDDMVLRIIHAGMHFSRPQSYIGGYVALEHKSDSGNPPNPHRIALQYTAAKRQSIDGLRSVKYSRLALEFKHLYTWVFISVKEAKIMEKYQEYLIEPEPDEKKET